ncbi:MAG: hypothetical protein WAT81_00975 [Candidatus Moraniibacteriota bacterium]
MPLAFQKYVEYHFALKEVLGTLSFYAFEALSLKRSDRGSPVCGVAPSHRVDLVHYQDGLTGEYLSDWITRAVVEGRISRLGVSWDDGTLRFSED